MRVVHTGIEAASTVLRIMRLSFQEYRGKLYPESLPGFEVNNWIGLFAPAGTPSEIVQRWNAEVLRTMQSQPIQARLPTERARFIPTTPEQFGAFVKAEIAEWAPVVKASGARVE